MITEVEKKNRDELFRLMEENPDLPVVPMVVGEICADDDGYYLGVWGSASIDEYLICKRHRYIAFKSWDDVFDVLKHYLTDEEFEKLPESEDECREYYGNLPWKKAIVVSIPTLYYNTR